VAAAVLDGEVIAPGARGISDYALLQEDLARGRSDRFAYYAFDLMHLDGFDLRNTALMDRKVALQKLLSASPPILYSEHLESEAEATQRRACEMGLEASSRSGARRPTARAGRRPGSRSSAASAKRFRSSPSSKSSARGRAGWRHSMSAGAAAIGSSTPASCAAATPTRPRERCAKCSIR
jgi:bifunctional non-homologous end joining protein LigD